MKRRPSRNRPRVRILSRRTLVDSRHFRVVEEGIVAGGRRFTYVYRAHGRVVHVVPVTARGEVVLVRQYRHPPRRRLLELPAGVVDRGETTLKAAKRELAEETGYTARRWVHLGGWHPAPSSTNMVTHYYLALGAKRTTRQKLDEFEFIDVELKPFGTLLRRFARIRGTTSNLWFGLALAERRIRSGGR